MYTWQQETLALQALASHSTRAEQIAQLREETDLSEAQAEALLARLAAQSGDRRVKTRAFYAVALGAGRDMAPLTLTLHGMAAATATALGVFLAFDGRPFLGLVALGVTASVLRVLWRAVRQHQRFAEDGGTEDAEAARASSEGAASSRQGGSREAA